MTHSSPTQAVFSASQESYGQKINTKVLFITIILFSERWSWRSPSSFLQRGKRFYLLPFQTGYSLICFQFRTAWAVCVNFMAEPFQNHPDCNVGQSCLFQWLLPSACGFLRVILEGFCDWVCESLSIRGANTQRSVHKQMYVFCLETCPVVPVLNIKNKLSCQGKNIVHNLILIFHAV